MTILEVTLAGMGEVEQEAVLTVETKWLGGGGGNTWQVFKRSCGL